MDYTQTVTYLLYGVAGLGGLLALVVLIMALMPPKLEEYEGDEDFGTFASAPYDEHDEYDGYDRADEYVYPNASEKESSDAEEDIIVPPEPQGLKKTPETREAPPQTAALPPEKKSANEADPELPHAEPESSSKQESQKEEKAPKSPENTRDGMKQDISDTASIPVLEDSMKVGGFTVRVSTAQDIGARAEQQDAIEIGPTDAEFLAQNGYLCVLCDGMGGMKMGGDAAQLAAKAFVKECIGSGMALYTSMLDAVYAANERVWALCRADDLSGAGTTLVAACVDTMGLSFVSVGDSHIYLLRDGVLSQLNIDHNYLTELLLRVRKGEITREQALSDPERSHLTSYLGVRTLQLVDRSGEPLGLEKGDIILLASDGLFKVLTQKEISSHLRSFEPQCANRLVDDVLRRRFRNQDNVSVIVISIE